MVSLIVGLGSNVGDRTGHLHAALAAIDRHSDLYLKRTSSFFESLPVGGPAGQKNFFNAAAIVETSLAAPQVVAELLSIEKQLGRERGERWGPRTIDLDLLLYSDAVVETAEVSVPHPRLHERRFALAPAAEIAPDWRHPKMGKSIAELLAALGEDSAGEVGIRVVHSPVTMQKFVRDLQYQGRRVAVVPTMGALHAGHISLIEHARHHADDVATTIFVNPTQFGPSEDFQKYPRTLDADLDALSSAGCRFCFVPTREIMYPEGFSTYVEPPAVAQPLEGVCRPGHFRGVATIVLKLFQLVPANVACFGEKDYQQLQVIRRMVADLNVPIEIIPCQTVREPDGLAMSSRNRYLSRAERQQALAVSHSLQAATDLAAKGERDVASLVAAMQKVLAEAQISRIDYTAIVDPDTLLPMDRIEKRARALVACHVGTTRLIDNRAIEFI